MSKRNFIQAVIARSLPSIDKRDAALAYAESLWDWLTERGYGDSKPGKPRPLGQYYQALTDRQKHWFDQFWVAFNYREGKEEAAMRWAQLKESSGAAPGDGFYQMVVDRAAKEAAKVLPQGRTRKMAQGWLAGLRFNDAQPVAVNPAALKHRVLTQLTNDLAGVRKLYEASKNPALLPQIEKLEAAIREARP